jgi:hypothetical protein
LFRLYTFQHHQAHLRIEAILLTVQLNRNHAAIVGR